MPVGPFTADVGFHFGRTRAVGSGNVGFLFSFRFHFWGARRCFFAGAAKHDATPGDDLVDVVASEMSHDARVGG